MSVSLAQDCPEASLKRKGVCALSAPRGA